MLIFSPVEMCGWLLRVDVRVDAQGHASDAALRSRDGLDASELAGGFGVDRLDAERDGAFELRGVLPTPVNTICRREAGLRATSISPTELASAALPSSRSRRAMASVEFAFSA